MRRLFAGLFAALTLAGCATTEVTGYTDPSYTARSYDSFVVWPVDVQFGYGDQLAEAVCEEIRATGASCVASKELFPPTRTWEPKVIKAELQDAGITAFLEVGRSGRAEDSLYMGSHTTGSATASGGTAYGSSQSFAMYAPRRSETFHVRLVDVVTRDQVWVGGTETSGQGMLNVTDDVFVSSLAAKLVSSLDEAGHL